MTAVAFHLQVPDKLAYTCRLLRKAVARNSTLVVTGAAHTLEQVNQDLWTFSATDFVPHCVDQAADRVLHWSPVVLTETPNSVGLKNILINLREDVPDGFEKFERVIEIVSPDDVDRQHARRRWKHYANAGFTPTKYDIDQRVAA